MSRAPTGIRRNAPMHDTYFALVKQHPLTSIRSESELDAAQSVLDDLLRQDLDDGGLAYLDALSELLVHMLDERGMSQADVVRATGLAKATVSDLVTGKRAFTVDQMQIVAKMFGLPGTVFMPRTAI
jgi:HTH-type transcriptional regulator/antitoxin HigA